MECGIREMRDGMADEGSQQTTSCQLSPRQGKPQAQLVGHEEPTLSFQEAVFLRAIALDPGQ